MTAKSRVAAVVFLVMCVVSAVASDSDKRPGNAAGGGFDCYTMCTTGCFSAGMTGEYCAMVCEEECAEDARKQWT
ncbi:hypothetical protein SETIT_9G469700v2 [Setaria italica]|uniref:Uncharacterized protein n=1 Tax=Setaria italica TaxID=4555 RepID=K4AJJ5_SETIT|nr:hypothetical protein SETIT_9G469700v2 [Setaria italica]